MEITSFSLNPNGTLSVNTRESTQEGNLDNSILLSIEQTDTFLNSTCDGTKTVLDIFKQLVFTV